MERLSLPESKLLFAVEELSAQGKATREQRTQLKSKPLSSLLEQEWYSKEIRKS